MGSICLCSAESGRNGDDDDACRCGARSTQLSFRRIEASLSRRYMLGGTAAWLSLFAGFKLGSGQAHAQTPNKTLWLTNLRLFNGIDLKIRDDLDILIEGNKIRALPARGQGPEDADVVDCGGRTVIPGLIDAHWHMTLAAVPESVALTGDINYVLLLAAREAGATLERGFTTVRDVGGPSFALKRAIDEHQWIVVTGWTPHWMFTRFKLKFLEDPKGIFGKVEIITAIARKGFGKQHPFVAELIGNIHMTTDEISSLLNDVSQNEYNEKEGAEKWVKEHQSLVDSWITN